ncbi:MAG: hypothetical protein RLZZ214_3993 [Verrucomicrobiota bacterium]|jgi:hypothetical protein
MKYRTQVLSFNPQHQRGFALVVTLSLMILLTVIAVGLLSLSSISLRSAAQGSAMATAQANARLALMLAIGDLQKNAGSDQRITAPGGILDENAAHPNWIGVWDSWKAGSGSSASDEPSQHSTIADGDSSGLAPKYESARADHFRRWLVSGTSEEALRTVDRARSGTLADSISPAPNASAVTLVSNGSLGSGALDSEKVKVQLVSLSGPGKTPNKAGRIGWWVGDESLKARIKEDVYRDGTVALTDGTRAFRQQSPSRANHRFLPEMGNIADEAPFALVSTRASLQLLEGAGTSTNRSFHHATPYSRGLLSDVREGGLKRDLSTILERPIRTEDTSDEFMLYRFDRLGQESVPIQDLSAYYQLSRTQLKNSSNLLPGGFQVNNPDFGSGGQAFTREYTSLYRQPIPIRVQYMLSLLSVPRTQAEKNANPTNTDTHKLHVGITPAVTFWNPNNVPLTLNLGPGFANQFRFFNMPFTIRWTKEGRGYTSPNPVSLAWLSGAVSGIDDRDNGFTLFTSGTRPIVFEPGQVRVFSIANQSLSQLLDSFTFKADREASPGWDPNRFIRLTRSDPASDDKNIEPKTGGRNGALTFSQGDRISFVIAPTNTSELANGAALQFFLRQSSVGAVPDLMSRHFQFTSRLAGANSTFNTDLMRQSFPNNTNEIRYEPRTGQDIISSSSSGVGLPFLLVNLSAGCETHESANQGAYAGRLFASRPFLHSSPITGTVFVDRLDRDASYHHGWNWWVQDINSIFDANVQVTSRNEGYYGGGFTPESGTSHVVQQEIPAVPPISIAALNHAHLGGFSLAKEKLGPGPNNNTTNFQRVTASGQGGLFPHTLGAIGNSYAHPYLKPDEAHAPWQRQYSELAPAVKVTLADHSYLANKALWDEYFFSSITPTTGVFTSGVDRSTALDKAKRFFFESGKLPNSRFTPYSGSLQESDLNSFFTASGGTVKAELEIAARLMVEGQFNVNSTSVEAWKALFSSLRGESTVGIDTKGKTKLHEISGSPAHSVRLPAGPPAATTADPADPNAWLGGRELSDKEIDQLARAMVAEVRKRGPFLSLSEFVNRRLDSSNRELSLKGALQAAIDAESVDINRAFRTSARSFSPAEINSMNPAFPEALEGPIAYGSSAYVDQADILSGLAEQLTPRGDTFVIRTYGDAMSPDGKVTARAMCEAVVQRLPEYLDGQDAAHLKQNELKSESNKRFGRRIAIISFRFLSPAEI